MVADTPEMKRYDQLSKQQSQVGHVFSLLTYLVKVMVGELQPPIDSVWAVMIVWRLGGKIIRTVLCCVLYDSCTQ